MIVIVLAAAMMAVQGGSGDARAAYRACLNDAVVSAKGANIGVDSFRDYARRTCAATEEAFKAKLISFNVKNGMSKKQAADDAEIQLDDYMYPYDEKYRYSLEPPQ